MNNCPKCGSKNNMSLNGIDEYDFQCLICGKKYGITNSDTFEYQQRLDKVLSKFENVTVDTDKNEFVNVMLYSKEDLSIIFTCGYDEEFILTTYNQHHDMVIEIGTLKLKTIESLLEDLDNV